MQLDVAMRSALSLARRGLGKCYPNPSVGCIILDRYSNLIGVGRTSNKGRPHAEEAALDSLVGSPKGGTAIISLEPCAHSNSKLSCVEKIINAGIKHVVIPMIDPDERTNGNGVRILRNSGIKVSVGSYKNEAFDINYGFFTRIKNKRPLVSLKIASSLDGKIATKSGKSKWITSDLSRLHGHSLRANHDVILVGINTILKDDSILNCRIKGMEKFSPVKVIADSNLRIPLSSNILRNNNKIPTIIWTKKNLNSNKRNKLIKIGVTIVELNERKGKLNLLEGLNNLAERGFNRVLVEGGSTIAGSLLDSNLIDKVFLYRNGIFIGGDGLSSIGPYKIESLPLAKRFQLLKTRILDGDVLEEWNIIN
jgi:diaminohydroxyphosphoribosylaminopyrimidine deaminase / 5-amino-6-(5-phosphoribosylamino)uracil reductase